VFANTGSTTVTDFDDGVNGQTIRIRLDGNTTVQNGAGSIYLAGGANLTGTSLDMLTLTRLGNAWYETSRSIN
jgi:hypothetical protein